MGAASWTFPAIGTTWQIDSADDLSGECRAAVTALVERYDAQWSRFRAGSVVDAVRSGAGRWHMPDDAGPLLELYDVLYDLTDGAMSPCVGGSLEHLGYDASYTLRARGPGVAAPSWSTVTWEPPYLTTTEPFVLDIGAAGKGYLADQVAGLLGEPPFTVDASGDLVRRGPAIRVALEHPLRPGYAVGVAELGDAALCASASNRRAWGTGLHHVLDARTGRPVDSVLATWVIAADALTADALATALFFVSPQRLAAGFDFTYVVYGADGTLRHSPDFPGELFS